MRGGTTPGDPFAALAASLRAAVLPEDREALLHVLEQDAAHVRDVSRRILATLQGRPSVGA